MARSASLPRTHQGAVDIRQTKILIAGSFRDSASGKTFPSIDPSTEETIAEIAEGGAEDVDLAVKAARKALEDGPWAAMDARERGRLMMKWADLIDAHAEELAKLEVLDNGKPINEALGYDIPSAAATIRYYAGWADKIEGRTIPTAGPHFTYTRREPVGVCGLIIPWNFPLAMAAWKLGPALAAGCTAVLKPAEQTPLTALRAGELALEAGIPPGVVNIVPGFGGGGAGEALVAHAGVDKIAFTGEHRTAEIIKRAAAGTMKRLSFELGGKSANIVFDDADLDEAVDGAFGAIFLNQGQNCCAGSRAFVHEKIYDRFVEKLAAKAEQRRLGDPFKTETEQGPQIDKAQFDKIMKYIGLGRKQGAECAAGGARVGDKGFFIAPTVFAGVRDDMAIATDEIFGPVVGVLKFKDADEAIKRANASIFGLAGAVWTRDIDKAERVSAGLKAGTVWVNCYNVVDPAAPFGGFKMSGYGRELGAEGLNAYLETKTVTMRRR
ncbi:MAG: aldehyde dehydrogenase family protein [Pseudomonadota bacterium]|nr:aldehyde dehydrogenase family protein [Pseudomonadota bacterium]